MLRETSQAEKRIDDAIESTMEIRRFGYVILQGENLSPCM